MHRVAPASAVPPARAALLSALLTAVAAVATGAHATVPTNGADNAAKNRKPLAKKHVAVATVTSPGLRPAPATPPSSVGGLGGSDAISCEPTLTSGLAGVSLKTKAARITDAETVEALVRPLRQLAAAQGNELGGVEVLGWGAGGPDVAFTDVRAQGVIGEVRTALTGAGYRYDAPGTPRKQGDTAVTLLTAAKPAGGAALMGFWIKTEHALLLAWGRVEPSGGGATGGVVGSGGERGIWRTPDTRPSENPALIVLPGMEEARPSEPRARLL